ncbi:hypothetical protein PENTCL1PPCAC_12179, partial [Pristionchus entomophagus]
VGEVKSHPRVAHLRSRHRVRYHSFFSNSDSLVSEDSASEEDAEQPSCLILLMTGFIVVLVVIFLTISGTLIFKTIGQHEARPPDLPECLEKARKWAVQHTAKNRTWTPEEVQRHILATLEEAKRCDLDKKMILSASDASVYAWSLYSTVGYGDMFMHSGTGQIVTIFYAFFSSALYLAVKAECGTIIARHLSDVIHFFRMAFRRISCFKHRDPHPHPLRPFVRFIICLGLFFTLMLILAVYMKVVEGDHWSWGTALYFAYVTMALIGLGDVVPNKKVPFIIFAQPLLLVGDTLLAQANWYMQDRLRYGLHSLLRMCQCERKTDGKAVAGDATNQYPSVTSKMLPLVPSKSTTTLKSNNMKLTKKDRLQFKPRHKGDSNYSLQKIPNDNVFGPDKKQSSSTPTLSATQKSASIEAKSTGPSKSKSSSAEPVPKEKESLL